ncbi:MAG: 50S ribosomal protein L4 [Candidatus Yanofskybacteria bacterium RIFCSPHIGHO2_01_FULL_45_42]|uniref:Large ribosomal subunit protein uL4 n=3 Tax=Candidatus Yanofskyibacteriota TaxID=1752733 RepID=A0A1F8F7W6_9BACT|nr:MAG: 50S ribosomal protein L4 [Candidatus Yanofskybacteria bacterium RIFCSPHIGHO2_01_FULL_45_42]OGN16346.1 MAG: 50S ribosomal protein L4 [Candidatus Yanofskybacteria bacterium RIFCSPHIGHO2_02_FULL_46_19]OGN26996.1 MAG: 50S ribosomal protein L4 [Candidatus Yanofskybacteria bacterium RIFCSPLOWO2_01_FULL_45_72]OGN32403.1 MAG: 50S ribosomal protein L4 [Candidatus Yanofskybacteria bacterium RIFCSPLOWO2_02_FULL_45_18]
MVQTSLYNQNWEKVGEVTLAEDVFGAKTNQDLVYQVVTSQMSNRRQNIAHTKTRSETRGGGKKPWRQKGTGRARHGSIRSPIWRGGGVTFGPSRDKIFKKKINEKMARKATAVVLSEKLRSDSLLVVDNITLKDNKTKEMAEIVKNMTKAVKKIKPNDSILLITTTPDEGIRRSSMNLPRVNIAEARNINALDLLSFKYAVILKDAVAVIAQNLKR